MRKRKYEKINLKIITGDASFKQNLIIMIKIGRSKNWFSNFADLKISCNKFLQRNIIFTK